MHYYKKNIGDYYKKAGRLTILQHGVYTLLIDACYDRERFPTLDDALNWCWASTDEEVAAVKFVLGKFFALADGIYEQNRIKDELQEYQGICLTNSINGKKGGRPKAKKTQAVIKKTQSVNLESEKNPSVSELKPKPLTTNHKPITKDQKILSGKPDDAINIIDYLNKKTGKNFQPVDSNRKFIIARIKEGHTVDKIKAVVDMKCVEWLNDSRNNKYLRPATLFNAEKFNQYVGEIGATSPIDPAEEYKHYRKIGQDNGINPTSDESNKDYVIRVKEKMDNVFS